MPSRKIKNVTINTAALPTAAGTKNKKGGKGKGKGKHLTTAQRQAEIARYIGGDNVVPDFRQDKTTEDAKEQAALKKALLDNPPKALPSTETEPKTSAPTPAPTPTVEVVAVAEAPVEAEAETEGPKNEVPAVVVAAPVVEAEAEVAEGPKHTEYLFVAPDAAGACVEECKEGEDEDEEPMWLHDIDLFLDAPTPKPITPAPTTSGLATIRAAVAKATASVDAFFRAAGRMVVTATCRVAKAGRAAGAGVVTVVHGLAGRVAALMA